MKTPSLNTARMCSPIPTHDTPTQTVRIEFIDSNAQSVAIAGTFNDWRPEVSPMMMVGKGRWIKDLSLPPGIHEYCLVVDGYKWVPDPRARETVSNDYGGQNAVLKVSGSE